MSSSPVRRIATAVAVVAILWGIAPGDNLDAAGRDSGIAEMAAEHPLQQAAAPGVSIGNASVREKAAEATLVVSLDHAVGHDVSVRYATVDGSAKAPNDYTSAGGVVTVPAGVTSTAIVLLIIDDDDDEDIETFSVRLSDPKGGTIEPGGESGSVTVVDADPGPNLGYLFAVFMVTWAAFFVYVFMTSRRHRAMRAEIEALRVALTEEEPAG